jgi:hypothetical protein
MVCSNDVKCPIGVQSYSSNFTFGQNEADPWNPNSQNEQDVWVRQQQHITLPTCSKFLLLSDGTRDGTEIEDKEMVDKKTCSRFPNAPAATPTVKGGFKKKPSSNMQPQALVTNEPLMEQSNSGPRMRTSKNILIVVFIFGLLALVPGAHASEDKLHRLVEMRIRGVSDKVKIFAQNLGDDLAENAAAQGLNGEIFAHNLVADVISSICTRYFEGVGTDDFTPSVVQSCVKSIYGEERFTQPAVQFSAVFGASLLCNYVVSEAYPVAQKFYLDGCEGLQQLAKRILPEVSITMSDSSPSQESRPSNVNSFETQHLNFEATIGTPILSMISTAISQASLPLPVVPSSRPSKLSLLSPSPESSTLDQIVSVNRASERTSTIQSEPSISEKYTGPISSAFRPTSYPSPLGYKSILSNVSTYPKGASTRPSAPTSYQTEKSSEARSRLGELLTHSQRRSIDVSSIQRSSQSSLPLSPFSQFVPQASYSNPVNDESLSVPSTEVFLAKGTPQMTSSSHPLVTNKPSPPSSIQGSLFRDTTASTLSYDQPRSEEIQFSTDDSSKLPSSQVSTLPTFRLDNPIKSISRTVLSPTIATMDSKINNSVPTSGSTPLSAPLFQTTLWTGEPLDLLMRTSSGNGTAPTSLPISAANCWSVELDFCPGVGCLNLMANNNHCGSCQNSCQDGLECFQGSCVCQNPSEMDVNTTWTCNAAGISDDVDDLSRTSVSSLLDSKASSRPSIRTPPAQLALNTSSETPSSSTLQSAFVLLPTLSPTTLSSPPSSSITSISQPAQLPTSTYTNCPLSLSDICSGTCVNYSSDDSNCGSCGTQCSQNWSCEQGECRTVLTVYVQVEQTVTENQILPTAELTQSAASLVGEQALLTSTSAPKGAGGFIAMGFGGLW